MEIILIPISTLYEVEEKDKGGGDKQIVLMSLRVGMRKSEGNGSGYSSNQTMASGEE